MGELITTPEDKIKFTIGDLIWQVAALQAQVDRLSRELSSTKRELNFLKETPKDVPTNKPEGLKNDQSR